jgi:hypothetical protein
MPRSYSVLHSAPVLGCYRPFCVLAHVDSGKFRTPGHACVGAAWGKMRVLREAERGNSLLRLMEGLRYGSCKVCRSYMAEK